MKPIRHFLCIAIALTGCLLSQVTFAALPPLYQSQAELRKLIADPKLEETVGGFRSITAIKKTDDGYQVKISDDCLLNAKLIVIPHPAGVVGPKNFRFEMSPLACP